MWPGRPFTREGGRWRRAWGGRGGMDDGAVRGRAPPVATLFKYGVPGTVLLYPYSIALLLLMDTSCSRWFHGSFA
jgi:hypothetical protein